MHPISAIRDHIKWWAIGYDALYLLHDDKRQFAAIAERQRRELGQ